jgi:hypothetical protein
MRAGAPIGAVDLRPTEHVSALAQAERPGLPAPFVTPGMLLGALEPTAAYEAIRPVCQGVVAPLFGATSAPAAEGSAGGKGEVEPDVGAIAEAMGRVLALGLELRTPAGEPVPADFILVQDLSALIPDAPPGAPLVTVSVILTSPPDWPQPAAV